MHPKNLQNCACSYRHKAIWTTEEQESFNTWRVIGFWWHRATGSCPTHYAQPSFEGYRFVKRKSIPHVLLQAEPGVHDIISPTKQRTKGYVGSPRCSRFPLSAGQHVGRKHSVSWPCNPDLQPQHLQVPPGDLGSIREPGLPSLQASTKADAADGYLQ